MTTLGHPTSWNTSPATASSHVPVNPDAPVELPHITSEPLVGIGEAAVLFAAGHAEAARLCLEDACARQPQDHGVWLMLLDLHRVQEQRAEFDAVHERYRTCCADGPQPVWDALSRGARTEMLELAGRLGSEEDLRPIFDYARSRKLVAIDMGAVSRIDFALAPKLCAALRLFGLQSKRVILAHVGPLHAQLLAAIGLHAGVTLLARRCADEEPEMAQARVLQAA